MNRMRAMACAYMAIGHATADPATTLMKSRRLMVAPRLKKSIIPSVKALRKGSANEESGRQIVACLSDI